MAKRQGKAGIKVQSKDSDLKADLHSVKEEIGKKYRNTIRWMFVFWIATQLVLLSLL